MAKNIKNIVSSSIRPISLLLILGVTSAELNIITKSQWNGREASSELTNLEHPIKRIVICHTASADCDSQESCSHRVLLIQAYQMEALHFDDIGYNFLIGNDGQVYEGRGWDHQGAFARSFNAGSVGIAFIGTFEKMAPTEAALQAAQALLEEGVKLEKLDSDYKLYGHKQLIATNSPGSALYNIIKEWPHWSQSLSS